MQLKIPEVARYNVENNLKRRREWMEAYCRSVLHERYGDKSVKPLWYIFMKTKARKQITSEEVKALNRCCKRLDIAELVERIGTYMPKGQLSIGFTEKVNEVSMEDDISQVILTAKNVSGFMESFTMKVKGVEYNWGEMNRFEFHNGLRKFLRGMVGESAYMFHISKLTTVIREEGKRLAEWYNENVRKEWKDWEEILSKK